MPPILKPAIKAQSPGIEKPSGPRPLVSKKYVLPPKPKPGRKRRSNPTDQSATDQSATNQSLVTCGLCSKDDCACEEIGIKDDPVNSTLSAILNDTTNKPAVPLKRTKIEKESKPARIEISEVQDINDKCGFCTDDTPCLCKDDALKLDAKSDVNVQIHGFDGGSANSTSCDHSHNHKPHPETAYVHTTTLAPITGPPEVVTTVGTTGGTAGSNNAPINAEKSHSHTNSQSCSTDHGNGHIDPTYFENESLLECSKCTDALSTLFCISLYAAKPLNPTAVSIPHDLAYKILLKHNKFKECDLGVLVSRLEVDKNKNIGVQSINEAIHELDS